MNTMRNKLRLVMDPLNPNAALLVKLGSIAVHAEEITSPNGHDFDKAALDALLANEDVIEWREAMDALGLLPVKR
jgi:vacuolar-type H+-ATPase subunit C/Vma6